MAVTVGVAVAVGGTGVSVGAGEGVEVAVAVGVDVGSDTLRTMRSQAQLNISDSAPRTIRPRLKVIVSGIVSASGIGSTGLTFLHTQIYVKMCRSA